MLNLVYFFSVVHASCWIVLQSCDVCLVMRTLLLLYNVTLDLVWIYV